MGDDDQKTLWCGNLSEQVTEELLYELFLQAGPLEKVRIPRDRDGRQKNFAFVTFAHEVSVQYAINLFRGTALFHRTLTLQTRGRPVPLPPPIRSTTLEQSFDFMANTDVKQQFAEMTKNVMDLDYNSMVQGQGQNPMRGEDLVMASLQGNWALRHHPYMDNRNGRDDRWHGKDDRYQRDRESYHSRRKEHGRGHNSWKDSGNKPPGRYHGRRNHHQRRE